MSYAFFLGIAVHPIDRINGFLKGAVAGVDTCLHDAGNAVQNPSETAKNMAFALVAPFTNPTLGRDLTNHLAAAENSSKESSQYDKSQAIGSIAGYAVTSNYLILLTRSGFNYGRLWHRIAREGIPWSNY